MDDPKQYTSIFEYIHQYLAIEIESMNAYEKRLFNFLDEIAPEDSETRMTFFHEVFNGAYIFIPDNGQLHQMLKAFDHENLRGRQSTSSHYSIDTQYSFQGPLVKECLFGTNNIDKQKGSWFQLEAHGTSWTQLFAHFFSYLKFVITGYNQGPHGTSQYTESNPYIIKMHDHLEVLQLPEENDPILLSSVLSDIEGSTYVPTVQSFESISLALPKLISPLPTIQEQS